MFQYAFGRYLAIKNNTNLKLHFTNALFNTQYSFGLDVFNINATIASENDLRKMNVVQNRTVNRLLYLFDERFGIQFNTNIVTQKYPYKFDSVYQNSKDNSYIQGYWANEKYFKDIEDILRKEFMPKVPLDENNRKILDNAKKTNSVSIHVRRGDLITNKRNDSFIGLNYYIDAINKIEDKVDHPTYYIFSDDIPWCKQNLSKYLKNAYYVTGNSGVSAYKDLLLMSSCKHNVVANSTFSWWGSWLNENTKKISISPRY
ncbi:MAG: alpha-1,2-fucosyltransferase [bacterium]